MLAAELIAEETEIITLRTFVLGKEKAAPTIVNHCFQDIFVRNRFFLKVFIDVIEFGMTGIGIRQYGEHILRLAVISEGFEISCRPLAGRTGNRLVLEGAEVHVDAEMLGARSLDELEIVKNVLPPKGGRAM